MRKKSKVKKRSNRLVGVIICILVVGICMVFLARTKELKAQNEAANQEVEELQEALQEEKDRTERLEEYAKYVNTKQYVEDMAREKLGLIYPGELVFKAE